VGQENFDWVVETSARMAVERAQVQQPGKDNLTWGTFVTDAVNANAAEPKVLRKATAKKETKPKAQKKQ
jgi:hypothetical protein